MAKDQTILIILCLALVAFLFYLQCFHNRNTNPNKKPEPFVTTGGMQNLGSVEYDLVGDYPQSLDSHELLGAPDFADLVDSGDHAVQPVDSITGQRPLERLQTLSDSYALPKVASRVLPFSQAAAKPLVHSYSVNAPRVNLKGKLYEMNLSEAIRGSVHINYDPNVALIGKSRHGPSDAYNPGFMTPVFDSLYGKLSGSHRNMPMYTAGAGQAGGLGGNGVEVIMDH